MSEKPEELTRWQRAKRAIKIFVSRPANILSVLALVISAVAFYLSEVRRQKDVPFELIPKAYEKYYEMNKIQLDKWYLAHLFVTPDRYLEITKIISENIGDLTSAKKAEYLMHERATADFMFTYYEQILYQWTETGDTERRFIREILDYFRGRLLKNPRLVYWWIENGGGLETSYEDRTQKDWNKYVLYKSPAAKVGWCDALGPFAIGVNTPVMKPNMPTC